MRGPAGAHGSLQIGLSYLRNKEQGAFVFGFDDVVTTEIQGVVQQRSTTSATQKIEQRAGFVDPVSKDRNSGGRRSSSRPGYGDPRCKWRSEGEEERN